MARKKAAAPAPTPVVAAAGVALTPNGDGAALTNSAAAPHAAPLDTSPLDSVPNVDDRPDRSSSSAPAPGITACAALGQASADCLTSNSSPFCVSARRVLLGLVVVVAIVLTGAVAAAAGLKWYPKRTLDYLYVLGFYLVRPLEGSAMRPGGRGLSLPAATQNSLEGRVAVVTGGTRSIGYHAAARFAGAGAHVVISGRTQGSADRAARSLRDGRGDAPGSVVGLPMDLSRFDDVRRFAALVREKYPKLHYLILNAGASHDSTRPKEDGKEWLAPSGHNRVFASNHLGHFLLTLLLAPHLGHQGSVVVVSSLTMWWGNPEALTSPTAPFWERQRAKKGFRLYATSKLANLCFARSLRPRVTARNITVVAMTPGQVATPIQRKKNALGVAPELGGEKVFESAFVSVVPTPDFVYPYWFPRDVFAHEAAESKAEARHSPKARAYLFRPEDYETLDFNLYGSVGPDCSEKLQNNLWKWSRAAVHLPPRLDAGDVFSTPVPLAQPLASPALGGKGGRGLGVVLSAQNDGSAVARGGKGGRAPDPVRAGGVAGGKGGRHVGGGQ